MVAQYGLKNPVFSRIRHGRGYLSYRRVEFLRSGGAGRAINAQALRLSEAARSTGEILDLIGNVTGKINRSLESHDRIRARRRSRCDFAVVDTEVENLATQAKQATDRTGAEIGGLKEISNDVVAAVRSIKRAIQHVSEFVTTTAVPVEEQSKVTAEMSTSRPRATGEAAEMARANITYDEHGADDRLPSASGLPGPATGPLSWSLIGDCLGGGGALGWPEPCFSGRQDDA